MRRRGMCLAGVAALVGASGVVAAAATHSVQRANPGYQLGLARLVSPQLGMVALDPSDGTLGSARLLVTTSAGRRFSAIGPQLPKYSQVDDVFFLDRKHGWLSIWNTGTVDVTVYRTRDGGKHWQHTHVTHHTIGAGAVATLQFLNPRMGWLVNEQPTAPNTSLYATTDGGAHWRLVAGDLPETAPVFFSNSRTAWQGGGLFARRLERSRNGGRSWTQMRLPVPERERSAHAAVGTPASFHGTIFVPVTYLHRGRADLAVFRTRDQGATWTLMSLHGVGATSASEGCSVFSGLPAPLAVSLASPSSWWIGVNRDGAWFVDRTADAGTNWQTHLVAHVSSAATYCPLPNLQALAPRTAWFTFMAGRRRELFTTSNSGRQWRQLQP